MRDSDRKRVSASTTIPVNPAYVRYLKSATQAMMLEACLLLSKSTKFKGSWFLKTLEEWEYYLGITQKAARNAKDALVARGILEQERRGFNQTLFYRINQERYLEFRAEVEQAEYEHIKAMQILDFDDPPSDQNGNAQCPKGQRSSAQKGNAICKVNDKEDITSPSDSGKPWTWQAVCEAWSMQSEAHSAAITEWCEYKRERKDKPYLPSTVKKNAKAYGNWSVERFASAVDWSIRNGYQGIFEQAKPKATPPPSSAAPLPAATPDELAQMRGFINHAHYLANEAAKVKP